jgi:hypothetical protein
MTIWTEFEWLNMREGEFVNSLKHGNELQGSIKRGRCLYQLRNF